jgi:cytoskeleton protein RodZ
VLKIDAKPVLELLPSAPHATLERVDTGLRAPFHDRPGRSEPTEVRLWHQPVFWLVALLLLAAAAFVLWPQRASWWSSLPSFGSGPGTPSPATAAQQPPVAEPAPGRDAQAVPSSPPAAVASVAAAVPTASTAAPAASSPAIAETAPLAPDPSVAAPPEPSAGVAVVRVSEPSWVEAHDARGNVLLSRTLERGEAVALNGAMPLRLVIGNAPATEVTLRGKRVTLGAPNRDNVVKLELR